MTTTQVARRIKAPRARVYRALVGADAVARWRFPAGMTCEVHEFDGVQGRTLRISLTYESEERVGKTAGRTDTYCGRFTTLVPNNWSWRYTFESDDAARTGEMTSTIRPPTRRAEALTCSRRTRGCQLTSGQKTTRPDGVMRPADLPPWWSTPHR